MDVTIRGRRPERSTRLRRAWVKVTQELLADLHVEAAWSEALDYSEPVYLSVDLDSGRVKFDSRLHGPPIFDDELDVFLLTPSNRVPFLIIGDGRRVLARGYLPDPEEMSMFLQRDDRASTVELDP